MLQNDAVAPQFKDSAVMVARLAPQDYHRYHFPLGGTVGKTWTIEGEYYTVNPAAVNIQTISVFSQNKRTVTLVQNDVVGDYAIVCVGATNVASITHFTNEGDVVATGDEFGYFAFGGSTLVVLFSRDAEKGMGSATNLFDADLVKGSKATLETYVHVNEHVGGFREDGTDTTSAPAVASGDDGKDDWNPDDDEDDGTNGAASNHGLAPAAVAGLVVGLTLAHL